MAFGIGLDETLVKRGAIDAQVGIFPHGDHLPFLQGGLRAAGDAKREDQEGSGFYVDHAAIPSGARRSVKQKTGTRRVRGFNSGIAISPLTYYLFCMSVLTCKLPLSLDDRLAELAKRRGVSKSALVREAIEAKIAREVISSRRRPANLIEALGESVGSIASGKRDLARNKKHLAGYGR